MATIEQARAQIQQARQQLESRREEAKKTKQELVKKRSQLPERQTQMALRRKMSGLQGREQRREITRKEKVIGRELGKVEEVERQLEEYEMEQIRPVEKQISSIEKQRGEFELGRMLALEDKPSFGLSKAGLEGYKAGKQSLSYAESLKDSGVRTEIQEFKLEPLSIITLSKIRSDVGVYENILTGERVSAIRKPSDMFFKVDTKLDKLTSSYKDLSKKDTIKIDDITLPDRKIVGDSRNIFSRARNMVTSIIGSSSDFEKGLRETYRPEGNIFVRASPTGTGSTGFIRPPTQKEKEDLENQSKFIEKVTGEISAAEAAAVPSLTFEKTIYLPTEESIEEYKGLLSESRFGILGGEGGEKLGGYRLSKFVSEQEEKLKQDLEYARAYNKIVVETGKQPKTFQYGSKTIVVEDLFNRLERGARGRETFPTGYSLLKEAADITEREGSKVNILGLKVSPTVARAGLIGSTAAYKANKTVLAFQLAGAGLGGLGLSPTITGSQTAINVFKGTQTAGTFLIGGTLASAAGIREFSQSKDLPYAIGAGVGTGLGFFGGVYSKQIVEAPRKLFTKIGEIGTTRIDLPKDKRGQVQLTSQESEYTEVYDPVTGRRIFVRKSELAAKKLLERFDEAFKRGGSSEVRKGLELLKQRGNLRGVEKLLENLKSKGYIKGYTVNILTGEFQLVDEGAGIVSTLRPTKPSISTETSSSLFTGTGQYERTEFLGSLVKRTPTTDLFPLVSARTSIELEGTIRQDTKLDTKLDIKPLSLLSSGLETRNITRQDTKLDISPISDLSIKQDTTQRNILKNLLETRTRQKQDTTTKTKITPSIVDIKIGGEKKRKAKRKIKEMGEALFAVFTRKGGKDVEIGEFGTKTEAVKGLTRELKGTLRASGFIEEKRTGRKLGFGELDILGGEFRQSKIEPFRIVQRREKRLGTKSEVFSIKAARRSKKRKPSSWLS